LVATSYHVVFILKNRRKTLYGQLRRCLGEVFRNLAEQKDSRIEEGHQMPDQVHMMISIPPKYAVSQVLVLHAFCKLSACFLAAGPSAARKQAGAIGR